MKCWIKQPNRSVVGVWLAWFFVLGSLSGCAEWPYYLQAVEGQLDLMGRRRSVESLLEETSTQAALHTRLVQAAQMREFAVRELGLGTGGSYRDFADLQRPYATWVVFAAPEFSLEPKRWCFPWMGCLAYRGYFNQAQARLFADGLRLEGLDVHDAGSPAYSTLGWFDDPLLNTFINWPDRYLAGLIFHELAHEKLYIRDDTGFNESFADAVSRVGVERWLRHQGDSGAVAGFLAELATKQRFLDQVKTTRERLGRLYAKTLPMREKRARKRGILAAAAYEGASLETEPGGRGYAEWWRDGVNNAKLVAVNLYAEWVPTLLALLARHDGDMQRFYQAVDELAGLTHDERRERLVQLIK
ncbi:MAG: aminopeptidase [Magnetococcus sp. YQC-5]